jgi:hypothetical protein
MTEAPDGYELAMPFVVVESVGGPYQDNSFVAGYTLGRLDVLLETQHPSLHQAWLTPEMVPQVDLIAMRHGYAMQSDLIRMEDDDFVWANVQLRKVADTL